MRLSQGTISGTCIGVAWLVALVVILVKRYRRKKHYKKMGKSEHELLPRPPGEEYIVPPDPAVLEGKHQPGDRVVVVRKKRWWRRLLRWEKKSQAATETRTTKGKEREPGEKVTQEVYGDESAAAANGRTLVVRPEEDEKNDTDDERALRTPPPGESVHPPHFNRLDTIMSVPEAAEDREMRPLHGTVDDGAVRKTDFAIGEVEEDSTSSGSTSEPLRSQEPSPPSRA